MFADSGVASPKNLGGGKMFDCRRTALFCLEKRLSKHKMAIFSKNLGGAWPFCPPGYVYVCQGPVEFSVRTCSTSNDRKTTRKLISKSLDCQQARVARCVL